MARRLRHSDAAPARHLRAMVATGSRRRRTTCAPARRRGRGWAQPEGHWIDDAKSGAWRAPSEPSKRNPTLQAVVVTIGLRCRRWLSHPPATPALLRIHPSVPEPLEAARLAERPSGDSSARNVLDPSERSISMSMRLCRSMLVIEGVEWPSHESLSGNFHQRRCRQSGNGAHAVPKKLRPCALILARH